MGQDGVEWTEGVDMKEMEEGCRMDLEETDERFDS